MTGKSDRAEDVGLGAEAQDRVTGGDAAPGIVTERDDAPGVVTGAEEADPTLDIVRQLITEAETLPVPETSPAVGTTPAASAPVPPVSTERRLDAPTAPWHDPQYADLDDDIDDDFVAEEALESEEDDGDGWDSLYGDGGVRGYGIVDADTGLVTGPDDHHEVVEAAPAAPRRRSPGVLVRAGRMIGRMVWALLAFVFRLLGALLAWAGRRLAAGGRVVGRFLARPDAPRRIAVALLVLSILAWPWKVLWLTLLVPLALVITWASVGSEGCAELTVRWHARLKARDPDKAERIRLRAAATSRAVARALDRLPERWTQGLYLPDFEPEGYVPEKLKVDPFEELAVRIHSEKRAGGT